MKKYRNTKRFKSCGKQAFTKRKRALSALADAERKTGKVMDVYKCPDCGNWHLSSVKPYWLMRKLIERNLPRESAKS